MSSLRLDMSELGRICLVWELDMSGQTGSHAAEK
jgi:hypothetical protein